MTINRTETDIRDQAHEMWAEGTSSAVPDAVDIKALLLKEGYTSSSLEVWYDDVQGFYRWYCNIKKDNI